MPPSLAGPGNMTTEGSKASWVVGGGGGSNGDVGGYEDGEAPSS